LGFLEADPPIAQKWLESNHKCTLRIYRAMRLNLPQRLKKRVPARVKQPLAGPVAANVCWSLDFTSDVCVLDYNTQRPPQALNFMTSIEFKQGA
jgi:putative transposase